MKLIIAIIQPDRLNEVLDALEENDIHLVTVTNVMGRGRQRGEAQIYRGHKEVGSLLRKVKLEIAINDEYVEKTQQAIIENSRTGNIGDGKIFVVELADVVRIRTGESGNDAIG